MSCLDLYIPMELGCMSEQFTVLRIVLELCSDSEPPPLEQGEQQDCNNTLREDLPNFPSIGQLTLLTIQ